MKNENFAGALSKPANYELDFCLALEYGLVIEHASDKLSLLLISCIKKIETAKAWYLGETQEPPRELLSKVLNPLENRACSRFDRFIESARRYPMGEVPFDKIVDCVRISRFFCQEAAEILHDISVTRLLDSINALVEFLSKKCGVWNDRKAYDAQLEKLADAVKSALTGLRDAFFYLEQRKVQVRQNDASDKIEEIDKVVKRIDARGRKTRAETRQVFTVETQEAVQSVWERAQASLALRREAKSRVSKDRAYEYSRSELRALGVASVEQFKACLGARSDRLYRSRRAALGR